MRRKLSLSVKRFRATAAVAKAKHHCRSAMLWIAVLLAVAAATAGHLAAQQNSGTQASPGSSTDASGQRIFRTQCAACHGLDGHGGEHAPSIVQEQVKALSDEDLARIVRGGIPLKGMPEFGSLGPPLIKAVVVYLRQMQGASTPETVSGDATRGRALFFSKADCAACHVMEGTGNFIADDLSDFGRNHQPSEIRGAILEPGKLTDSPPEQATATTRSGTELSGVVLNEDNFSLQLQGPQGDFYLIVKTDVVRIKRAPLAPMPTDYSKRLTPQEIDDVVTYIARQSTK